MKIQRHTKIATPRVLVAKHQDGNAFHRKAPHHAERIRFAVVLFVVFIASERRTRRHASAHAELDQFNLEAEDSLTPAAIGVRKGSVLVMVRNYNALYNLAAVLDRIDTRRQDVVVLHLRFLERSGSGESDLTPDQLFSVEEQTLFTRALELSEKKGKPIHLAVAAATEKWGAIVRAANSLQASTVVLGGSPNTAPAEEARLAGLAWERLPEPRPQLALEIRMATSEEHIFYLGPHAPRLIPEEIDLLHSIWLDVSNEMAPNELHHHDIVRFSLEGLKRRLDSGQRSEILTALRRELLMRLARVRREEVPDHPSRIDVLR